VLLPHRFEVAQVSLRGDPLEESCFAGLVGELIGLERLTSLRHELVPEKIDMVFRRVDFFERVAQRTQRLRVCAVEFVLSRSQIFFRFANSRRVFARIYPRDGERNSSVNFTGRLGSVVVALCFNFDRGIGNPISPRESQSRLLHVDPGLRDFDLRSVSERDLARLHHRNVERFDVCFVWAPQRREGVAIHQDVELRLLGRNVSQNVLLGFKQLARFHLAHERLGRVGLADFVTRAADFGDLAKRNQIPSIQFQLGGRIEQAEIGSARLGENIQLLAARPFKSFDCIRSGKAPNANIDLAIRVQTVISLSEMAERYKITCLFDEKTRKVTTADGKEVKPLAYDSV